MTSARLRSSSTGNVLTGSGTKIWYCDAMYSLPWFVNDDCLYRQWAHEVDLENSVCEKSISGRAASIVSAVDVEAGGAFLSVCLVGKSVEVTVDRLPVMPPLAYVARPARTTRNTTSIPRCRRPTSRSADMVAMP